MRLRSLGRPRFFLLLLDTRRAEQFAFVSKNAHRTGQIITDIGKAAGVVVARDPKTGAPTKYASAHDLRRAFGFRWSRRVMPPVLMEMMRHSKIETTMKFYVGENADATAEELWSAVGKHLGKQPEEQETQTL